MATTFGPYTPIHKAGNLYFISGQVGVDANKQARPDLKDQTIQVLENLKNVLLAGELQMNNVVKTTIFLKNIRDFNTVNEIYLTYFEEPRPARSCVEVVALPRVSDNELLVEIEAVAYAELDS